MKLQTLIKLLHGIAEAFPDATEIRVETRQYNTEENAEVDGVSLLDGAVVRVVIL